MGSLKTFRALLIAGVMFSPVPSGQVEAQRVPVPDFVSSTKSLFTQSAVQVLQREFSGREISFLLFDAGTGVLLTSHWDHADKRIPLGSLVKPFTALAYAETHEYHYPVYICRGEASGCWQRRAHGKLTIVSAIAASCNSYFRELAADLSGAQMLPVVDRFGLDPPESSLTGPALIGLGDGWQISPLHLARAYLELAHRRDQPGVGEVLAGMAQSARRGTGMGVGRALKSSDALVKTGTARCIHEHHAPGDGFVVALVPALRPELLLMIRVHGVPGAAASVTAGHMLSRLEE
jgi:transpeptidase family protein